MKDFRIKNSQNFKKNNQFRKWAKAMKKHFTEKNTQMVNKYMKRCLVSLAIKEMPIKTMMRHHYTLLNIHLSYNLPIALLGIYPREMKTCVRTKTCTQISMIDQFVIDKNWKQLKCPSTG